MSFVFIPFLIIVFVIVKTEILISPIP
jgi:hypothetical protein